MAAIFQNCSSLTYLDLSKFDASNVTNINYMFEYCSNLTYLDLSNFNTLKVISIISMFKDCSKLNFINLKQSKLSVGISYAHIFEKIKKDLLVCSFHKEWSWEIWYFKIIKCINNFNETIPELYCFYKNFFLYNKYTCNICGSNYHEKYNESYDNNSFINCYESLKGYFFYEEENISFYKPCYYSCRTCNQTGNDTENNCIDCNNDYKYLLK